MDVVMLRELRVDAVIGVHPWERQVVQTLLLDLELAVDAAAAAAADRIEAALDYQAVAEAVTRHVEGLASQLVETVAEEVAALLRRDFGVPWVRVTVHKPGAVPRSRGVAVRVERGSLEAG